MSAQPESLSAIAVPAPELPLEVVAETVARQFGLAGNYSPLVSERDQNFRLVDASGCAYVVKIVSSAESVETTDFQIEALLHLEARGVSGVPRVIHTLNGGSRGSIATEDGEPLMLRVVSWIDGEIRRDADATEASSASLGRKAAELDRAFVDFSHTGENQVLLWDTQRAAELRGLIGHIDDAEIRANVECALDDFESRTLPVLATLPAQVIHNDINGENVLYNDAREVCGIIDFGDMLRAPRIVEVSTAAAYLRCEEQPLRLIAPMISAYRELNPLTGDELEVLYDLVRTRLCMTVVILYWRISARDADDPYRLKTLQTESSAAPFLACLNRLGRSGFAEIL